MNTLYKLIIYYLILHVSINSYASGGKGSLNGTVKDKEGLAVEGVNVMIEKLSNITFTNKDGEFRMDRVPEGTYTVIVQALNVARVEHNVTVKSGETATVDFVIAESIHELGEVIVEGVKANAYIERASDLATRTPIPLLETPQSIQAVPQRVIQDQQAVSLNEVTKNMAGVTNYSIFMDYTIRGFRTNFIGTNLTVNGVRGVFYDFSQAPTMYNVESVEAIKGPASALFSAGGPGGIINITTKQPLATERYEVKATYGSFNQYRIVGDATGPLGKNKKLLYRFIAGYENSDSYRDYQKVDNLYIAPSLTYLFSSKTKLSLEVNYMRDRTHLAYERGLVAPQNLDGSYNFNAVPLNWSRHNPNDRNSRDNVSAQMVFKHKFSDKVSFTSLMRYSQYKLSGDQFTSYSSPANDTLQRIFEFYPVEFYSYNTNNFAQFNFNTGSLKHTLLAGFDFGIFKNPYEYKFYDASPINIYQPTYLNDAQNPMAGTSLFDFKNEDKSVVVGGYVQDQIEISEKFKALLSLRQDNYVMEANYTYTDNFKDSSRTEASVLLPRIGLVYQPVKNVSIYASYSESFNPNSDNFGLSIQTSGGPFKPEKGIQYELGFKSELIGGKLIPTISLYHIEKNNVLIGDPTDPLGLRKNARGKARSQGIELTLQGSVTDHLRVIANYAYNETKITEDNNPDNVGNWLPNAPNHLASTWIKYDFSTILKGFGVGAGFTHVGKRVTEAAQDFKLPAFTSYEASVSYTIKSITAALNVYNLADTRNFTGGYNPGIIWTGPPRSFRLSISYLFQ